MDSGLFQNARISTESPIYVKNYRDFNNKLRKVNVVFRHIQSFKLLETMWFGMIWVAFFIFALFFWKCGLIEELRRTTFSKFWKCPSLKFSKMVPFDRKSWKLTIFFVMNIYWKKLYLVFIWLVFFRVLWK